MKGRENVLKDLLCPRPLHIPIFELHQTSLNILLTVYLLVCDSLSQDSLTCNPNKPDKHSEHSLKKNFIYLLI